MFDAVKVKNECVEWIRDFFKNNGPDCNAVIGISGGLDSTLALLVAARAFDILGIDRANITAITMPGFGTSDRTHDNALILMQELLIGRTGPGQSGQTVPSTSTPSPKSGMMIWLAET